jgi:hypothetical protein
MTTRPRFFKRSRRWRLVNGLALLVALLFTLVPAETAQAAPRCTTTGTQVTCTFTYTGASEPWTVPAGVTEVTFEVYGAQGGAEGGGRAVR